jgi:hypothetical protein
MTVADPVTAGLVLAWIVIVVLAFALAGLLGQVRELRQMYVDLSTSSNTQLVPPVPELTSGERSLVLVVAPGCETCRRVAPYFASRAGATAGIRRLVLAKDQDWPESSTPECHVMVRPDLHERLRLQVYPSLLMLAEDGRIMWSEPVGSVEMLERILGQGAASTPSTTELESPRGRVGAT